MREYCTPGSARGPPGNRRFYLNGKENMYYLKSIAFLIANGWHRTKRSGRPNPKHVLCLLAVLVVASTTCKGGTLREAVHASIAAFESSAKNPKSAFYPQLADRIREIFPEHSANKIDVWTLKNGVRGEASTIYVDGERIEIVADVGWNVSTDDQYVYEWKTGSNSGSRIKRNNGDLVDYLYYATDPSWIMASVYGEYLRSPTSAHVVRSLDPISDEIVFDKPMGGVFEAVYASRDPLWFYGFRGRIAGKLTEFRVSKPQEVREIPARILARRLKINFRDAYFALRSQMDFL